MCSSASTASARSSPASARFRSVDDSAAATRGWTIRLPRRGRPTRQRFGKWPETWPHLGAETQQRVSLAPVDQIVGLVATTIEVVREAQRRTQLDPPRAAQSGDQVGVLGAEASADAGGA